MPLERGHAMEDVTGGRPWRQQSVAALNRLGLTLGRYTGGVVPARMRAGVQPALLLLLLVGCVTPDGIHTCPTESSPVKREARV
jgi:hypothetical protein